MSFAKILQCNAIKASFLHIRPLSCWSCGQDSKKLLDNMFCTHCRALQPVEKDQNYFRVLGVRETFDLQTEELVKRHRYLQQHLHPDKFATKDQKEQEISATYSSLVNEAYKTLLQPLTRGIYMLSLRGKEIPEQSQVDQEFLMEIMEKNQEVEDATNETHIMRLNEENKTKLRELEKQISHAFFDGDLKLVIRLLGIMKYYTSIDNQIQASIRNKGIIR